MILIVIGIIIGVVGTLWAGWHLLTKDLTKDRELNDT